MFPNPFRAQSHTRRALSDQVRQEWRDFETWFKAQQSTMEKKCAEKFKEMDKDFHAKSSSSSSSAPTPAPASKKRMTAAQKQQQQKEQEAQKKAQLQKQKEEQKEHDESKNAVRLSLRKSLVLSGREEWQKRLGGKGLQDEDWVDMTEGEQMAVQRLLGGDFDEEEEEGDDEEEEEDSSLLHAMTQTQIQSLLRQAPLPSTSGQQPVAGSSKLPTPQHPQPSPQSLQASLAALQTSVPPASSLPSASRSTNPTSLATSQSTPTASTNQSNNVGGSYAFVNPSSFGHPRVYEDDDDDDDGGSSPFEDLTFFSEVLKQPASSNSFPSHPASSFHSESSSLSGWSTEFSLSSTATSTQTSHTGSPEQPAPKTIAADPMPGGWNFAGGKLDATPTQATASGKQSGWLSSQTQTAQAGSAKQAGKQPQRSVDSSASTSSLSSGSGSGSGLGGAPASTNHNTTSTSTSRSRVAGPPYIGPVLNTQEDYITYTNTHNTSSNNLHNHGNHNGNNAHSGGPVHVELTSEEADFENFKMDVRIRKIHEFHREAAAADEALIRDIFRSRKLHKLGLYDDQIEIPGAGVGGGGVGGNGGSGSGIGNGAGGEGKGSEDETALLRRERERRCYEEENKKIVEHEKTMVHLRKLKEDERKEIVDDERRKRRNAIKRRSVVGPSHTQQHQQEIATASSLGGHVKAASAPSSSSAASTGKASSSSSMGFGSGTIRAKPQSSAPISASMLFPPQLDSALSTSSTSSNASYAASAFFTPSSFTPSISSVPLASSSSSMEDSVVDEFAFDEAKIASILAAQAQMAQKFDSWAPTAGAGSSQNGSPRGPEETLPSTVASAPASSATGVLSGKNASAASSSSLGHEKKSGNGKEKEGTTKAAGAASTRAPAIPTPAPVVVAEPEPKPVANNSKLSKAAKKKGKKGASAPEAPAPTPAPVAASASTTAKSNEKVDAKAKGKESAVAAKVVEPAKDAGSVGGVGGKVTVSKEALQQATVPQPSAKSPWAKKEEPAVAKSKSDAGIPVSSGSQQQSKVPAQKEPVAARWKFSLFDDDEPMTATAGATSSKTTFDQAASAALSGLKSTLLQPPTQGIWMPGGNMGVARASSDQPTGGLKAPDVAGVLRTVSDQSSAKSASASAQAQAHMASRPEIWLPPKAKQTTGNIAQPQPQQPQQQSQQPWDRKPMSAAARARRMSEPAPPSPVDPAFFADPSVAISARRAADAQDRSILKKGAKSSKKSGVMVEEVSDDEETEAMSEALPTDSRHIMEENPNIVKPKASVPSKMFDNIIAYDEEDYDSGSTISGPSTAGGWDSLMGGMAESKSMKAKHVRWTPSALGNASPTSFRGDEEGPGMNIEAFLQDAASALHQGKVGVPPAGGRGRTGSMSQGGGFKWGQANNRAGDVEGRTPGAPKQDSSDELGWYAMEAMKQMRSKPASAV